MFDIDNLDFTSGFLTGLNNVLGQRNRVEQVAGHVYPVPCHHDVLRNDDRFVHELLNLRLVLILKALQKSGVGILFLGVAVAPFVLI